VPLRIALHRTGDPDLVAVEVIDGYVAHAPRLVQRFAPGAARHRSQSVDARVDVVDAEPEDHTVHLARAFLRSSSPSWSSSTVIRPADDVSSVFPVLLHALSR